MEFTVMNRKYRRILIVFILLFLSCIKTPGKISEGAVDGEIFLRALQNSYPDKVGEVAFVDGDWTITAGGQTFFWAEGRLLPETQRKNAESFDFYDFYYYPV